MVIYTVKARAYALRGDGDSCQRQVSLAEQAHRDAQRGHVADWRVTVATASQLHAGTGHAMATLARRTNSQVARVEARRRLSRAITDLDQVGQARATALCIAQRAILHLEAGELEAGVGCGRRLLEVAGEIRSYRLNEHLARLRTAADAHASEVRVKQLVVDLEAFLPYSAAPCRR